MNLYNIGLGAATNIKAKWDFPVAKMATEINKLAQQALIPAYHEYKDGFLEYRSEQYGYTTFIWKNERTITLDYLLPQGLEQTGRSLTLPRTFVHLVSSYLYFLARQKRGKTDRMDSSVPPLDVFLEYNDISGAQHSVVFGLQFEASALSLDATQPMDIQGYIEPRKRG